MLPPLSVDQIILLVAAVQALAFSVLLFAGARGRRRSNEFLAALLFCVAASLGDSLVSSTGLAARVEHLAFVGNSFALLLPPLVYLHAKSMMYATTSLERRDAWHLLPFVAIVLASVFGYHLQAPEVRQRILDGSADAAILSPWIPIAIHVVVLAYVAATLRELRRYATTVRQIYSNLEHKTFSWLVQILVGFVGVWLLGIVLSVGAGGIGVPREVIAVVLATACLIFVNLFLAGAIRQPELFAGVEPEAALRVMPQPPGRFSPDEERTYGERLEALMASERPFLDSDLTLDELAGRIGLPERDLSALLNETLGRSFYDFVNARRIDAAKSMLGDPAQRERGVLDVMIDSGFKSKSAFYEAFRRHAGTTPAEYRRRTLGSKS